ncbi:MAG: hypothetical protein FWG36_02345 [Oscillospiraceae bacterium]|nr:hypothetical protein [Oscillospiraceae bacterium]
MGKYILRYHEHKKRDKTPSRSSGFACIFRIYGREYNGYGFLKYGLICKTVEFPLLMGYNNYYYIKGSEKMAGYIGRSMSVNAAAAHTEGRKPVSSITKEDIQKYGVNVSITFFRWFVKKYCDSNEWHHTSSKYNETWFYDVKDCCSYFLKQDIEKLKKVYKSQLASKHVVYTDDTPYYALVKYSISTYSGGRKHIEAYAIVHRCWAYIKDDYRNEIIKKKINGKHFNIAESYQSRPEKMSEDVAMAIYEMISKITGKPS